MAGQSRLEQLVAYICDTADDETAKRVEDWFENEPEFVDNVRQVFGSLASWNEASIDWRKILEQAASDARRLGLTKEAE